MLNGLEHSYFMDATGATGAGKIEQLFANKVRYLLVDEIDKLKKSHQSVLLNLMEIGILSETKLKGKTRQRIVKVGFMQPVTTSKKYLLHSDQDLSSSPWKNIVLRNL
jgi:hypothetical protein